MRRVTVMVVGMLAMLGGTNGVADEVSFNRDIRPILSDKCFACHGFDEASRQADLRLDQPGAPLGADEVDVMGRVTSVDPDLRMPPPEFGKSVTEDEAERLRQWIRAGAVYEDHWAWSPIRRPPVPQSEIGKIGRTTPVDQFVCAKLETLGLVAGPPARPEVLARRVAMDLIGMQADQATLTDFLADPDEAGYRRLVDRLLASPAFGEHQARYWLDAARYGDTHGMARDDERSIWPYRDWVVRAINANQPFDQFTIEQIAGDLLPDATRDQIVATGFLRCNVSTAEGGSIEDELRVRYAGDRLETVGTMWLAMTVGCAACHDHKFDPISQNEYYQLSAFFAGIDEEAMNGNALAPSPTLDVASAEQVDQISAIDQAIRHLQDQRDALPPVADQGNASIEWRGDAGDWRRLGPFTPENNTAAYLDAAGPPPERIQTPSTTGADRGKNDPANVGMEWDRVEGNQVRIIGDNSATFLFRRLTVNQDRMARLRLASDEELWKPLRITVWVNDELVHWDAYRQADVPFDQLIDLALRQGENRLLVKVSHYGGPVRGIVEFDAGQLRRPPADPERHRQRFGDEPRRTLADQIDRLWSARHKVRRSIPTTMVCRERDLPRETFVLKRGAYDQPVELVVPGVPSVLPPITPRSGDRLDRLDLARWLVDDQHPLTARVVVNRFWQNCFGRGLVETSEDFGTQGSWPSHPELLDWLSAEFIESGWDVKRLVRTIVCSHAYRRSSVVSDPAHRRDPGNRFLATGPRGRLSGEVLRDCVLQAAGMIDRRVGGRGVKPPQPPGLWRPVSQPNSSTAHFVADRDASTVRRSLYTFWKRTSPPPMMQTFDAPTRESCRVRRSRTNTPLQALVLMNDPQMVDAARQLALRARRRRPTDVVSEIFWLAIGRRPEASERKTLESARDQYQRHFQHSPQALIAWTGDRGEVEDDFQERENDRRDVGLAAEMMVAHTVLNLSEMVTKE